FVLKLDGTFDVEINVAGILAMNFASGFTAPDTVFGNINFGLNVNFYLEFNVFSHSVTFYDVGDRDGDGNSDDVTLAAGPLLRVFFHADLQLGVGNSGFLISGDFLLEVKLNSSGSYFLLTLNAKLYVRVSGTNILTFDAKG